MARLSVGGADDAHAAAGLQVAELQQHHSQVVDEQQGVHQGHGELDDAMVVLVLPRCTHTVLSFVLFQWYHIVMIYDIIHYHM